MVDDERQILELLELSLGQHGFTVTPAGSGPQALKLLQTGCFDLVVLDVLMSPWDGFETARRLRLVPGCPPIIFLSGVSGALQQQRGLTLAAAYLTKPFRPSQLVEVIWRVLRESGRPEDA
ncbi:response regulator [Deinococcus radiomollis]|uniref:response regulator transcription factor n=1 Tax=Deinococcus radiomollis TaxID=468916 RepID=UPI003891CB77